jgi:hypothetical protein
MAKKFGRHIKTIVSPFDHSVAEMDGIPVNDARCEQVHPSDPVMLRNSKIRGCNSHSPRLAVTAKQGFLRKRGPIGHLVTARRKGALSTLRSRGDLRPG